MRLVSYSLDGDRRFGAVDGDRIRDLTGWAGHPTLRSVLTAGALPLLRGAVPHARDTYALAEAILLPPVPDPDKCVCVGSNYAGPSEHPGLFLRVPGSFTGSGQPVRRPRASVQLDYGGGIALVIGKPGRHIPRDRAMDHLAGLTLCNGGSVRDWMRGECGMTAGSNFHHSGSLGPWMATADALDLHAPMTLTTRVNGEVRQHDTTDRLAFPFDALVHHASTIMPLLPGDLIVTGTPAGTGAESDPPHWLVPGDVVEVEVPGLGILRNTVADEG